MTWLPEQPFNNLPPLPPTVELETHAVQKACIPARAALATMNRAVALMPNPAMLVDIFTKQGKAAKGSQCVPTDSALWPAEAYRDFMGLRRAALAVLMNAFIREKARL